MPFAGRTLLVLLAAASPILGANVHVVAPVGGDFAEIQDAVDAAADGDVILVKDGGYSSVTIIDRDLTITADAGAEVSVAAPFEIVDLGPTKRVLVSGVRATGAGMFSVVEQYWRIANCSGSVLLQDCSVGDVGFLLFSVLFGASPVGMHVVGSADVTLTRFEIDYADLDPLQANQCNCSVGFPALSVTDSEVAVFGSVLEGFSFDVGGLGAGLEIDGGRVFASSSTLRGGAGVAGFLDFSGSCVSAGDGGPGVSFLSPTGELIAVACHIAGGAAGIGQCDNDSVPGAKIVGAGFTTVVPLEPRGARVTTPVHDGGLVEATFSAETGDIAFLLFSLGLAPSPFLPALNGPFVVDASTAWAASLGIVGGSGEVVASQPVSFPFAGQAGELFVQAVYFVPPDQFAVSTPQSVLYLGPGL